MSNAKPVNNNSSGVNFNFKTSSSYTNNQLANNTTSNKFVGSYKNNHVITTRNISVPLPLPNQDIDLKTAENHSKDRMVMVQGMILNNL